MNDTSKSNYNNPNFAVKTEVLGLDTRVKSIHTAPNISDGKVFLGGNYGRTLPNPENWITAFSHNSLTKEEKVR